MSAAIINELCLLQKLEWKCQLIFEGIDLCSFLDNDVNDEAKKKFRWVFHYIHAIDFQKNIVAFFLKNISKWSYFFFTTMWFFLLVRSSSSKTGSSNRLKTFCLHCDRWCIYRGRDEKENIAPNKGDGEIKVIFTTKAFDKEDSCPFCVTIFLSTDNFWYLSSATTAKKSEYKNIHSGHHKLPQQYIRSNIAQMSATARNMLSHTNKASISSSASSIFLELETSQQLSARQLIRKESLSAADELVRIFSTRTDVSWVMLIHEPSSGFFVASKKGES